MVKKSAPQKGLLELFDKNKCMTIQELSKSLDYSMISIRRFMKDIGYYSSFTHNSKWYTLLSIPSFNEDGLWFYRSIGFSMHGNLNQTIVHFINNSERGLTAKDLQDILFVPSHPVLTLMYKKEQIDRFRTTKGFVYLSIIEDKKIQQLERLQSSVISTSKKIQRLTPQSAVYVLVEFIKHPHASFSQISNAVGKKQINAPVEAISQLFKDHGIKKIPK